jgi:putative transposase
VLALKCRLYYLSAAVMDWFSLSVLSWAVSIMMDVGFCLETLDQTLEVAQPGMFNTDQGAQFTSIDFTGCLESAGIQISMDGRRRALDNVFVERLWRMVKYEEVYLNDYETPREAIRGLVTFFVFHPDECTPSVRVCKHALVFDYLI